MKKYNDCIHVEGVYIAKVLPVTRRVHVRAVPVSLKICTTPSYSVRILCLFCQKYDQDACTIFPTLVL